MALPRFRGDRLLAAREAAGLTREALTLALELSSPLRITQWETGRERPRPRFIPGLAAAVGVDPLNLLDVDPADPPLAALRLAAGITTVEMAAPGMSVMTYSRLEDDGRVEDPSAAMLAAIASRLGVHTDVVAAAVRRTRADG